MARLNPYDQSEMSGPGVSELRAEEWAGPYRLLERIGIGGMGEVSLARDDGGRTVAVKVLHPAIIRDVTTQQRLKREVETMRLVRDPHVAEVIDAGFGGERPYIVTRYVPGLTLDENVRKHGPLRGTDLDRVARGLARALTAIHAAGVVHRDLKPANVVLVEGEPVVIDFGLAHTLDATRLTLTGATIGTPGYLAPEILDDGAPEPAADVFSWATTVAFAATGRPPYGTGPREAIFSRVLRGRHNLSGLPKELAAPVRAALARDPAQRPSAADLIPARPPKDQHAPCPPVRRKPVIARMLATLMLIAAPALSQIAPLPIAAGGMAGLTTRYLRDTWNQTQAQIHAASGGRLQRAWTRLWAISIMPIEVAVRVTILAAVTGGGYLAIFVTLQGILPADRRYTAPLGLLTALAVAVRCRYNGAGSSIGRWVIPVLAMGALVTVVVTGPAPSWWPTGL